MAGADQQGDGVRDTASLLPPLIEAGIRVLIYSGEADAREFSSAFA